MIESIARFAVNADDLLFVSDDAGFDTGGPRWRRDQSTTANVVLIQELLELLGREVLADDAEQFRGHIESRQVAGHVGRAAGHKTFAPEIHHRHGGFGRDARHTAPNKVIEHDVADNQHAGAAGGGKYAAGAGGG